MGIGTITPRQQKRRNRLFFVGIDQYDNWPTLQYPVSDCRRFFTVLKESYGFSDENFVIQPLFDGNAKTDIVFDEICYLADKDENGELRVRPDENLIIYFSGHGHFDKNKEGYWVPSDAPLLSERPSDLKKLISVSEVIRILSNIRAHHIVLIVDACFSEAFTTMEIDVTQESQSAESEEVPSRWVLTAGRNGVVPDKSPFADALINILRDNADPSVSINWLGAQITKQVRDKGFKLEPLCKSLVSQKYKLGEFFFHRSASDLLGLFANPMMLTLYSGANNIALRFRDDDRFHFKKVTTYGELLWNFNEAQLAQLADTNDEAEIRYQTFLLRVLVPYIAYRMEDRGKYAITIRKITDPVFNLKTLLDEAFAELDTEELTDLYPAFEGRRRELGLGVLTELDEKEQRSGKVKQFLVERLRVLVMEGDDLRFLHQNFRDFFAVCHIRNMAQVAMIRRALPEVFFRNYIPVYLRRLLGEIEGEHHCVPVWNAAKNRLELPERENLLSAVMDLCRDDSGINAGDAERAFVIRNVLTIWLDVRQSLAGANLTNLDLRQIQFNGLPLTRHKGAAYLPARFEDSILDGDSFIFKGHYGQINQVHYSPDGRKLLTASDDCTIKEWLTATGKLIQTFTGHGDKVISARYSPDGKKVVSASHDTFVKEWLVNAGTELASYEHLHSKVYDAVYSPDGTRILTCADDRLVREWSVATSECIRSYAGHTKNISSVCYNTNADQILSASADTTVREWSAKTGVCLRILAGHTEKVNSVCYSPGDKHILSASDDHTIIEWSPENDIPFRTFKGHSDQVYYAAYSADGERILSASKDKTIREWSIKTGLETRTYTGHSDKVNYASYSPDKPRLVSASDDKSIREWSMETATQLYAISGQSDWVVNKCIVSPDAKKLLTVNYDRTFTEIHIASGIALQVFRGHEKWLHRARYSPDGTKIISCSDDLTIREWLVETGECIRIYKGHAYGVEDAVYIAEGAQIISRDFGRYFRIWSVATGECLETVDDEAKKKQLHSEMQLLTATALQPFQVKCRNAAITVRDTASKPVLSFVNVSGMLVQGCDFRHVNPASNFSEAVRNNLKSYGAIFTDGDETAWEVAKADN